MTGSRPAAALALMTAALLALAAPVAMTQQVHAQQVRAQQVPAQPPVFVLNSTK